MYPVNQKVYARLILTNLSAKTDIKTESILNVTSHILFHENAIDTCVKHLSYYIYIHICEQLNSLSKQLRLRIVQGN